MTPTWRRALADNRVIVVPLALLLLVNLAAYAIVVRPLQMKSEGAADRAAASASSLKAAQAELAQARQLADNKAQAEDELAAFYQQVLPANLTAARRMTYASLPALARRTNVRYEARTTTVGEAEEDPRLGRVEGAPKLDRMTIRMVLQGEYRDIRRFIYELETASEFVIIDNVTLTERNSDEPQTLTIDLSTYYRPEGNGR